MQEVEEIQLHFAGRTLVHASPVFGTKLKEFNMD